MCGMVATWPKSLSPFWIFSRSVRAILQLSLSKQQDINHRPVCVCIRDMGLGRRVWKTTKQENQSAKSTAVERNTGITCWEHTDSLEWDYVLSVPISLSTDCSIWYMQARFSGDGRWIQLIFSIIWKSLGWECCMHQKHQIMHPSQDQSPLSPGFLQMNTAN